MKQQGASPAILWGVAFVWFTTQFGGGFASGRQLIDFFVSYGIYALFTPILAQLLMAVFLAYVLRTAYTRRLHSYNDFTDDLYGPYKKIMTPVFEVIYNITLVIATSVAFATGGATISQLFGLPYLLCSLLVGIVIFIIAAFGADLVRRTATITSILIVIGMLLVYVPNLVVALPTFGEKIALLSTYNQPPTAALWKTVLYFAFQSIAIGAYIVHARAFKSPQDANRSMVYGFIVNAFMVTLVTLGMISAIDVPEIFVAEVPVLEVVTNGVGAQVLTPIVSLLIILGSVSTGVTFVYGAVDRFGRLFGPNRRGNAVVSFAYTALCFAVAQFGLIPLVAKGYAVVGIVAIVVLLIPIIVKVILAKRKKPTP